MNEGTAGSAPSSSPTPTGGRPSTQRGAPGRARYGGLRREFVSQGAFLYLPEFLRRRSLPNSSRRWPRSSRPSTATSLPGHKQWRSVSATRSNQLAPFIGELYRSPALIDTLEKLAGERLQVSPPMTRMPTRVYFYTRPGDSHRLALRHVLLCRPAVYVCSGCSINHLPSRYELHTRETGVRARAGGTDACSVGYILKRQRDALFVFSQGVMIRWRSLSPSKRPTSRRICTEPGSARTPVSRVCSS